MNRPAIFPHPGTFFPPMLTGFIRSLAPEAESLGRLHPEQLALIYEQKWFNLFVPAAYDGLALSLPDALAIEEALAWTDGSLGWTVTLCSGANWFAGFLDPELAKKIFQDPRVCLAGSGRPNGIAKRTETGYEVTGSWQYATGAPHATAFTANCRIEEAGSVLSEPDGSPLIRSFLFLKEEVSIFEDWRTIGMVATASHRFEVAGLQVPEERAFLIDSSRTTEPGSIYRYPFLQFAETTLAVNSSGMAARFLELAEEIRPAAGPAGLIEVSKRIIAAKDHLQGLRNDFYKTVYDSWDRMTHDREIPAVLLEEVTKTSRRLATGARQLVDEIYPLCGVKAADPSTEINRVWRDLHTASQHSLLNTTG